MGNSPNRLARQVAFFLATLAFLVVSTVALTHGHPNWESTDESHCAMCMAVHSSTHAVATPAVTLYFTAVQNRFLVFPKSLLLSYAPPVLNQDRAPPTL
jgi:hypothetical protein